MNLSEIPLEGIVYKLIINDCYYIGSTFETLKSRILSHKSASKSSKSPNRKVYKFINDNGGWDNVKVEILFKGDIDEKTLLEKEQSFIVITDDKCINSKCAVAPNVPVKYKRTRDDKRKQYDKDYYEQNKEKIKARRMEWYFESKNDPVKYQRMLEVAKNATKRYKDKKKESE
jgi:hypothetical protein